MSLTMTDKKWIDSRIGRSLKSSEKRMQRYVGIVLEQMKHDFALTRELIETRPTREEVREIVREEIHLSVDPTLAALNEITRNHEQRISHLESGRP